MAGTLRFRLEIEGPEKSWQVDLGPEELTIGRVAGSQILLENSLVSRRHAQVLCSASEVQITDLNSSNGTYVNGQKLAPGVVATLHPSDVIKIGPFRLLLTAVPVTPELASPPEAEPASVAASEEPGPAEDIPQAQPEPEAPPTAGVEAPTAQAASALERPGPGTRLSGGSGDGPGGPGGQEALAGEDGFAPVPAGLSIYSQQLIHYLPGIYQTDFMQRFLGIFESILIPIEWNVDNFDLFLDPGTAPGGFLPWLASWFGILCEPQWSDAQRRAFLKRAHFLFARRGTRLALAELLQIFTGQPVEIDDTSANLPAATFRVRFPLRQEQVNLAQISALIDAHKPAHTTYVLEFAK